jgi:hypothetical protein
MFPIQIDRTTIFGVAAAVMFWSNAMAQTVSDAGGNPTVVDGTHANNTNTARAASNRYRRPYRSNVVVTTANGGRVVVGLINPGHRQRTIPKAQVEWTAPGGDGNLTTAAGHDAFAAKGINTGAARISKSSHSRDIIGRKAE